jgi:hypothetical protein
LHDLEEARVPFVHALKVEDLSMQSQNQWGCPNIAYASRLFKVKDMAATQLKHRKLLRESLVLHIILLLFRIGGRGEWYV